MRISIDITGADERALTEAAQLFNVPPDELAAAALSDFLTLRDEEFERAAQRVLAKHRELYRRLV
jgi:antitoxin FitA